MTRPPFVILSTVDSTNNHAMRELRSGPVQNGTVYFALEQTMGKGQREKKWDSNAGENIMMSMIWESKSLHLAEQFFVSCATALACHDFFNKYAGNETRIKWPNDLYWRDRKAGGILIENIIRGRTWETVVMGIGININQVDFPSMKTKPVSLKQITGLHWDVLELAHELNTFLLSRLAFITSGQKNELLLAYNENLYLRSETARIKTQNKEMEVTIDGVNEKGELMVSSPDQMVFSTGQMEWIL